MTGAVVGAALLTNMILVNSVRASDRGWEHLMAEREWEENIALLKDGMINEISDGGSGNDDTTVFI